MMDWLRDHLGNAWGGLAALVGLRDVEEQREAFQTAWLLVWIGAAIAVGVTLPSPFDWLLYVVAVFGLVAFLRSVSPLFDSLWNGAVGTVLFWR